MKDVLQPTTVTQGARLMNVLMQKESQSICRVTGAERIHQRFAAVRAEDGWRFHQRAATYSDELSLA